VADYTQGTPIEITDTFTLDGVLTNPTLVTYTILGPDGTTTIYTNADPEVDNPSVGEFVLSLAPLTNPGSYAYSVVATGAVEAARNGGFYIIPDAAIPDQDVDWAVGGPCQPWVSSQDIWECCGSPMTTIGEGSDEEECPVDMTKFAIAASNTLYELSGRQFSGACEKTVRPCGTSWCGFQTLSRGYIVNPYWWNPYWDGMSWWLNGSNSCACRPLDSVKLSGYPVREIIEVLIDGSVVDPLTYRLDRGPPSRLYRVPDPLDPDVHLRWPGCQAMGLPDTEEGTFSVTYRYGQDAPLEGQMAAQQLGCELYKACAGQACALPTGTTRVNRQGITIEKPAFYSWGFTGKNPRGVPESWNTGMSLVDHFLNSANSSGLKRRPVFWAPGAPYARTVGQ
jgi:hypothetical protein